MMDGATCDFCPQPATSLAGETNGVLVCADHVERVERPLGDRFYREKPTELDAGDVEALTARIYAQRDDLLPSRHRDPHAAFTRDDAANIARAVLTSDWHAEVQRKAAERAWHQGWVDGAASAATWPESRNAPTPNPYAREEASR